MTATSARLAAVLAKGARLTGLPLADGRQKMCVLLCVFVYVCSCACVCCVCGSSTFGSADGEVAAPVTPTLQKIRDKVHPTAQMMTSYWAMAGRVGELGSLKKEKLCTERRQKLGPAACN